MNTTVTAIIHDSTAATLLAPLWMRIAAGCIGVGIAAVGGIGSLTVLAAFATTAALRTKQNIYLFCLTVADLLVTTVVTPIQLDQYLRGRWIFSHGLCRSYVWLVGVSYLSSLNFTVLISRDRWLMISKGAAYDTYETAARKWLFVAINLIVLPVLMFQYTSYDVFTGFSIVAATHVCQPEAIQNLYATIGNQVIFVTGPCIIMAYYYARVRNYIKTRDITKLATASKTVRVTAVTSFATIRSKNPEQNIKSRRAVRIMNALLANIFLQSLLVTPNIVLMNVLVADPSLVEPATFFWWTQWYSLVYMSSYISLAIDPILYAYAMPQYRKAMGAVWRKK